MSDQAIRLICFDIDKTLTSSKTWHELNVALGVTPEEDAQLYDAYHQGRITYDEWAEALFSLYQNHGRATRTTVESVCEAVELMPGATDAVAYCKERGYDVALISGSFDVFVAHIANRLQVDKYFAATRFLFDTHGQLVGQEHSGDEDTAKVRYLKRLCDELSISLQQCVCVGDGANDVPLFQVTGHGITFADAPASVKREAWQVIGTLRDLPSIL